MKVREVLRSGSFWRLFIINIAIIAYYLKHQSGFNTLVWIYWCQSVLIGLFTFLQLATIKVKNEEPVNAGAQTMSRGCFAGFFAFHYGFFHVGYFVFIAAMGGMGVIDWSFLKLSVAAFALDQLWNFIQSKLLERDHPVNGSLVFFLPYARIIPMHIIIILPLFLPSVSPLILFLVLKMFADLLMHAVILSAYANTEGKNNETALII